MLMFCRSILLLWNILPFKQLFACPGSSAWVHSFFLAKQLNFNILIYLHAISILNIVQQIEVILLVPVHHIIHSIRAHDQTTQALQISEVRLSITLLLLDFNTHCLASGFLLSLSQIAPDQSALTQIASLAPGPAQVMLSTGSIRMLIITGAEDWKIC